MGRGSTPATRAERLDKHLTDCLENVQNPAVAEVAQPPSRRRAPSGKPDALARLTRALWADLRPSLMPDPRRPGWSERYLLQICEGGMARVAADPRSQPMAARSLFAAARSLMRAQDQLRTVTVIDAHLERARAWFEAERAASGLDDASRCAALNRKGKPCGREPMWGTAFCVSHTVREAPAS